MTRPGISNHKERVWTPREFFVESGSPPGGDNLEQSGAVLSNWGHLVPQPLLGTSDNV